MVGWLEWGRLVGWILMDLLVEGKEGGLDGLGMVDFVRIGGG